jgi:hypothetical protein
MNCENCKAKMPTLHTRTLRVNSELHQLGLTYHNTLSGALHGVDRILLAHGFCQTDDAFGSSLDGRLHEQVGDGKWVSVAWHRLDSGRYEVVAYVN